KDIKDETPAPAPAKEGEAKAEEKPGSAPTYPVLYPANPSNKFGAYSMRDAVQIQFPVKPMEGTEKPHFFLGDPSHQVNLWYWMADKNEDPQANPVEELNANGYKAPAKAQAADSQNAQGKGVFKDGRWHVVMKRALTTKDANNDVKFVQGKLT